MSEGVVSAEDETHDNPSVPDDTPLDIPEKFDSEGIEVSVEDEVIENTAVSEDIPGDSKEDGSGTSSMTVEDEPPGKAREPYFFQIGFDFGTSYSKCICRDVITDKAWVHVSPKMTDQELPFLIPSNIVVKDGHFIHSPNPTIEYHENGLYHIKLAIEKAALHQWDDPALNVYKQVMKGFNPLTGEAFVKACGIYFLAGAFGEVRRDILKRFPDFGSNPQDYMAVNLAIPVADAERHEVNDLYEKILLNAWALADQLCGFPQINPMEINDIVSEDKFNDDEALHEACFIYPEVSANVQGFVRSRTSKRGIYLFSDTGAGSVDQSIFIFDDNHGVDYLWYLHGNVLAIGSSMIEHIAASVSGNGGWRQLEMWRQKKEIGEKIPELTDARGRIEYKLGRGTQNTLAYAKKKLIVKEQLYDIRLIFGGGGHCIFPYETGVKQPFSGSFSGTLFPKKGIVPDVVGMPVPRDLELADQETRWMRRLSVAYGLSFVRTDLVNFTYPRDLDDPKPEEIWKRDKPFSEAPTKDEC